ncbi:MAG: glycosyltransferase family 4 protein [Kiritimatiellae bacterium]|nr:glycosyltransferase family 4 protein [Kiritimatiellia bacterium]
MINIANVLQQDGHSVFAILPRPGYLSKRLNATGIQTTFMPLKRLKKTICPLALFRYIININKVTSMLTKYIRQHDIDVVHANSNTAHIYAGLAALRTKAQSIWHSRDLVNLGIIRKLLNHTATKIIATSNAVEEHLKQNGVDTRKIVTIHNCVDLAEFEIQEQDASVRNELGIQQNSLLIAAIGQLIPWKKLDLFIETASAIHKTIPKTHFLIVGDDIFNDHSDYRKQLRNMANESGLENSITFTGYRLDIMPVLRNIDILVHTADREPFGRVLIEAMALGKPVVAINSCGPTEIIENNVSGMLVEPDNPQELARCVTMLAEDKNLTARISSAARLRIEQKFNIQTFSTRICTLYKSLSE